MQKHSYMYRKTLISLSVAALMLVLGACSDWLHLKPENNIVKDEYWVSKENVHSALVGCYASLLDDNLTNKLFLWGEIRTDEIEPGVIIADNLVQIMTGVVTPTNTNFDWKMFYKSINLANTVLAFAKDAQKADATYTIDQLKADEAEARALRSLLYFYLVRTYGDVPLMTEAIVSDDQNIYLPKSSQSTIISQIINDLDTAAQKALPFYGQLDYDKGRFTRYGINALQADVYLWNSDYQKCIEACNKIIYSGQYGLVQTPDSSSGLNNWYSDNFVTGNSNESIFEFQFNATKSNPFYDYFSNAGKWSFIASTYVVSDGSLFTSEKGYMSDLRAKPSSSFTASQMVWKYVGLSTNGSTKRSKDVFNAHWIVYRLADIYLMRAEALNQLDRGQEAIGDIKAIQGRAYADTTYQIDNTDKDGITDLILKERQKEFLFEGKRWFDVLRHARRDHFGHMRYIQDMIGNYASASLQNELINRYTDTLSLYFPIPQSEIDANPNLKQNKYYDPSNQ